MTCGGGLGRRLAFPSPSRSGMQKREMFAHIKKAGLGIPPWWWRRRSKTGLRLRVGGGACKPFPYGRAQHAALVSWSFPFILFSEWRGLIFSRESWLCLALFGLDRLTFSSPFSAVCWSPGFGRLRGRRLSAGRFVTDRTGVSNELCPRKRMFAPRLVLEPTYNASANGAA